MLLSHMATTLLASRDLPNTGCDAGANLRRCFRTWGYIMLTASSAQVEEVLFHVSLRRPLRARAG
jgi:hypothetical protein